MATGTPRRVVVTGLGATSPLGGDVPSTWAAALAGTSGARTLDHEWVARYDIPVTFAAALAMPTTDVLSRGQAQRLDPSGQMAVVAAREAWADAGTPEVDGDRLGVVIASGIGGVWTLLSSYDVLREKGPRRVFPLTVPMLMPNGPAAAVSLEIGARAGVHTPVSACASGAESIGYAMDMIRSGRADMVVAGGTEAAIHPLPIAGFAAMKALSTRNDSPQTASRPYDSARDGFVLGEGAAVLVLEAEEHARARGATIYAEVAGCRADLRRPPHLRPRPGGHRRGPGDLLRPGGCRCRVPPTSATSTPTPPPRRSVTSPRPPRSGRCWATRPTVWRCRRRSR